MKISHRHVWLLGLLGIVLSSLSSFAAQQTILTNDVINTGRIKINDNFTELYNDWFGPSVGSTNIPPTINDDTTQGFQVGATWLDTTADEAYVALDVSTGAAVWLKTTGGIGNASNTELLFNNSGSIDGTSMTWDGTDHTIGSGQLLVPDGTASVPALAFTSDIDTGWYTITGKQWHFTRDGNDHILLDGSGVIIKNAGDSFNAGHNSAFFSWGALLDARLYRDDPGILGLQHGTPSSPAELRVYGSSAGGAAPATGNWLNLTHDGTDAYISSEDELGGSGSVYINTNAGGPAIQVSGNIIFWRPIEPEANNTRDIGTAVKAFRTGYFGTSLNIGATPASTGAVRMTNNEKIVSRNAADTGDVDMLWVDSSDNINLGDITDTGLVVSSGSNLQNFYTGGTLQMQLRGGYLDPSSGFDLGASGDGFDNVFVETSVRRGTTAGITASVTQTQGNGALTTEWNEVSTVANDNDTVTLPTAVAGWEVTVINNGANLLQIFPASGDNLGAGLNLSTTLATGCEAKFKAYDGTNWKRKGAVFGSLSAESNATATTISSSSTDFSNAVQVTIFDTDQSESGVDTDQSAGNDHIVIKHAGWYNLDVSASFSDGNSNTISYAFFKNNGATQLGSRCTRKMGTGGDVGSTSGMGRVNLSVGDTIELWVQNESNADNVDFEDITMSVEMCN